MFPSINANVIGCRWVYKVKQKSYGSLDCYKARLVAQGYNQKYGLDYDQMFSAVVKPVIIQTVFALAASKGWVIHQLDVKNAFLHGTLNELVYMKQSTGFVHQQFPHHVCRLKKPLYSVMQAPRAWFHRFISFLVKNSNVQILHERPRSSQLFSWNICFYM